MGRTKSLHYLILVSILILLFIVGGCQKQQKPEGGGRQQKPMPEEIEKIEQSALEIMSQADLIPLVEKVSQKQAQEGQEGGGNQGQQGGGGQGQGEQGGGGGGSSGGQGGGGGSSGGQGQQGGGQQQGQQQETITFEETILAELLNREKAGQGGGGQESAGGQKLPQDTGEVWDKIKMTLVELHDQWNALEPLLVAENVSPDATNGFEEALDNLTLVSIDQDYFGTLTTANQLTKYLPQFMEPFAKDSSPQAFELKYYLRSLVLNAAINDYASAWENFSKLKERERMITKDLEEKKAQATAEEYQTSLEDLERALAKEDVDLIIINAAVVMDNIMQMIEDLQGAM